MSCPPKHYHSNLGTDIISAYLCLHKRGALNNWPDTSKMLEFYCIQVRDGITTKRMITHFEGQAHSATTRDSVGLMTEIEVSFTVMHLTQTNTAKDRPNPDNRDFRAETPQAKTNWWKFKKKPAS